MKRSERGFTIAFAALVAAIAAALIVVLVRMLMFSSRQNTHLNNMDRTFRLAETGLNVALGRLAINPNLYVNNPTIDGPVKVPDEQGEFENLVQRRDNPVVAGYYIITTASRTVSGREYVSRLHTYAQISNVGDYFAAVTDVLTLSDGIDASTGKAYAPKVSFLGKAKLLSVDFVNPPGGSIDPPNGSPLYGIGQIEIAEPTSGVTYPNEPQGLNTELIFPQVLDSDIQRYKTLAHVGDAKFDHTKCEFNVEDNKNGLANTDGKIEIFPPGYWTPTGKQDPYDDYDPKQHSDANADHVYYCNGDMYVRGEIHGQILFVATGTIHISSSIFNSASVVYPGAGSAQINLSSSTANEAVLISRKGVTVDPTYHGSYVGGVFTESPKSADTETIDALILAPNGTLDATMYTNTDIDDNLKLDFLGSIIVGHWEPSAPHNFPSVFNAPPPARHYAYNQDFKDHPPPYLPALSEIYYSWEESKGDIGLAN